MKGWFPASWVSSRNHPAPAIFYTVVIISKGTSCIFRVSPPTRHMCIHVFITYVIYLYWSIQQGVLGYWLSQFPEWALLVTLHQLCEVFTHMRREYVKRFAWDHSIGKKNEYLKINVIVFWDQASCTLSWPLSHNVLKDDLELVTFLSPLRCAPPHLLCDGGNGTQGLMNARQWLSRLNYCPVKRNGTSE